MTYEEAKAAKEKLEAAHKDASHNLHTTRHRLSGGVVGVMSQTPDHVKTHPEFVAAKIAFATAHSKLADFNSHFTKHFQKEYQADREANRRK